MRRPRCWPFGSTPGAFSYGQYRRSHRPLIWPKRFIARRISWVNFNPRLGMVSRSNQTLNPVAVRSPYKRLTKGSSSRLEYDRNRSHSPGTMASFYSGAICDALIWTGVWCRRCDQRSCCEIPFRPFNESRNGRPGSKLSARGPVLGSPNASPNLRLTSLPRARGPIG